jgi:hypothetical protein
MKNNRKILLRVIAIYDNDGKTRDRYTVFFNWVEMVRRGNKFHSCMSMDATPFKSRDINMRYYGKLGRHNGKHIEQKNLPLDCQKAVTDALISWNVERFWDIDTIKEALCR